MDIRRGAIKARRYKFYSMIGNITPCENPRNKIKFPEIKIIIFCKEIKKNYTMAGKSRKITPWLI